MSITDQQYLKVATALAQGSHCVSKQVAAIAVKNGRIVSTGINGTIPGAPNCDALFPRQLFDREHHHRWSLAHENHAEQNLLAFAAREGVRLEGSTVYCTLEPCPLCLRLLIVAGVARVVYGYAYDKGNRALLNEFLAVTPGFILDGPLYESVN